MQYTNVKLPYHTAAMFTDDDVHEVIKTLVGHDCEFLSDGCYPAIGCSPFGPYDEGDIVFYDNGGTHQLSYDFMELDGMTVGRVFRYEIVENVFGKNVTYLNE